MAKNKNKLSDIQDLLKQTKEQIKVNYTSEKNYIPSIIEFVESPKYLGFSVYNPPIDLFPMQKIILKVFYRGSLGNEHLELTEEEIEILQKNKLISEINGDVLGKYLSSELFQELVLVWGRRCVSEDVKILDASSGEYNSLGDLWDSGKIIIDAWTYDEETKSMRVINDALIINQGEKEIYLLETDSGHSIEVTNNHPLLTDKGWILAENIKIGHKIAFAPILPFFGKSKELSEDEASLLGYLTSHLMTCQKHSINVLTNDQDIVLDLISRVKNINPNAIIDKPVIRDYAPSGSICSYTIREDVKSNNIQKIISKYNLANKGRNDKSIPEVIFNSPKKIVASFLKTLIASSSDVKYYDNHSQFHCRVDISFIDNKIASDVQHLLHRFGIFSSIESRKINGGRAYTVSFSRKQDIKQWLEEIGIVDNVLLNKIQDRYSELPIFDDSRLVYSPVLSLRKFGKKRTFDIQVSEIPHLQNFTANGIICHNSGKDFLVSIMALYEAMRLLESPGGNPHAMYNLSGDVPFTILSVANSSEQAAIVYNQIKGKMLKSPYFDDKYLADGITAEYIYLLTPEDKKMNIKLAEKKLPLKKGSVQIRIGHSESNTLVGLDCYVILFDEIGLYKNTEGPSSGDALYNNLTPALQTYVRKEQVRDENGNLVIDPDTGKPKLKSIYDGKVICISTPRGQEGIFYKLYKDADLVPYRLMCRLPTWMVNTWHTEENLREKHPNMSEDKFNMEFGALFSGTAGDNFFTKQVVDLCFRERRLKIRDEGIPGIWYFAHLDPATSSHNYALCICHKEPVWNESTNKRDFIIIVDHLKVWSPTPNAPINVEMIDEYMLAMSRRFYFYLVTYDQWESSRSILKLREWGIPARKTPFSRKYKKIIYDNVEQLATSGRLLIPEHPLLKNEMYNLQRRYVDSGGYRVGPKKDADVATDDVIDAVAAASYNATLPVTSKLPQGKMLNMPVIPSSNNVLWRSMQGVPLGYGNGQAVAKRLQERNPFPPNYR